MVWKCCVVGCTSRSRFPVHRFPKNDTRAKEWLQIIKRPDLIDASKEEIAKLRICSEHFRETDIITYASNRRLKDNTVPTLSLPENTNSTVNSSANMENIQSDSNLMPMQDTVMHLAHSITNGQEGTTTNIHDLRKKIRSLKNLLSKKKRTIAKQRKQLNIHRGTSQWAAVTTNLRGTEQIFMDIVTTNFNNLPQDNGQNNEEDQNHTSELTMQVTCYLKEHKMVQLVDTS